jgi:hypothetical protein
VSCNASVVKKSQRNTHVAFARFIEENYVHWLPHFKNVVLAYCKAGAGAVNS